MYHRHLHKKKLVEYFFALLFIIIIFYLGNHIGFAPMIEFMRIHFAFGIISYFIYSIISNVIFFLPLVPLMPVMSYLYGMPLAIVITVTGTMIGALICFFLAKYFGKKLVIKMMGRHLFAEVEHLSQFDKPQSFLLIRLFGNNYYDIISYMAGLSKMKFKTYFLITLVNTIIWNIILFFVIDETGGIENMSSFLNLMAVYAILVLIGTFCWEIYHKKHL